MCVCVCVLMVFFQLLAMVNIQLTISFCAHFSKRLYLHVLEGVHVVPAVAESAVAAMIVPVSGDMKTFAFVANTFIMN